MNFTWLWQMSVIIEVYVRQSNADPPLNQETETKKHIIQSYLNGLIRWTDGLAIQMKTNWACIAKSPILQNMSSRTNPIVSNWIENYHYIIKWKVLIKIDFLHLRSDFVFAVTDWNGYGRWHHYLIIIVPHLWKIHGILNLIEAF